MGVLDDLLPAEHLVGRDQLIAGVRDAVTGPGQYGALIVADAGLGKTAAAQAVLRTMGGTIHAVKVSASPSLSAVPFGALAPYLTSLSIDEMASVAAVQHTLERRFRELGTPGGAPPLVVVDDVHELDGDSISILAQLIAGGTIRVIILSRPQALPEDILGLWSDGLLRRFDISALDRYETAQLCVQVLGGPVIGSAAAVLHQSSGGNPMFLRALIGQALRLRHLVERNGVWLLIGQPPAADLQLTDLVRGRLMRRKPAEREVLETVALAEPIPLEVLAKICDADSIDSLELANMIDIDREGTVRPTHPLYGELVRQLVPAGRSLAIRQRVVDLMDSEPRSIEGLLRYVCWALDCGVSVADRQLLQAARVANKLFNSDLAHRVASSITEPALAHGARVEMARAHYYRGNHSAAIDLLDGLLEEVTNFSTAKEAAVLLAELSRQTSRSLGVTHAVAEAWRRAVERIVAGVEPEKSRQRAGAATLGYQLMHCHALALEGKFAEAENELAGLLDAEHSTDETQLVALALMGEVLASTGRPDSGRRLTSRSIDLLSAHDEQYLQYFEFVMTRHMLALVYLGAWDEMRVILLAYTQRTPRSLIYYAGALTLVDGLLAVKEGHPRTGLDFLVLSIEALNETDLLQVLPLALGVASYCAALLGENDLALKYVDDLAAVSYRSAASLEVQAWAHVEAARSLVSSSGEPEESLRTLAARARQEGMLSVEKDVLELSIRVGDLSVVPRMIELTDAYEGAESRLINGYAQALADDDPMRILEAGEVAAEAGYRLLAAECAAHAVRIYAERGETMRQRASTRLVKQRIDELEGATTRLLNGPNEATELTRREQEIVALAAAGASNRDIAIALSVSLRTVEGHLYRIFAKLGISRREDLARTVATTGAE